MYFIFLMVDNAHQKKGLANNLNKVCISTHPMVYCVYENTLDPKYHWVILMRLGPVEDKKKAKSIHEEWQQHKGDKYQKGFDLHKQHDIKIKYLDEIPKYVKKKKDNKIYIEDYNKKEDFDLFFFNNINKN